MPFITNPSFVKKFELGAPCLTSRAMVDTSLWRQKKSPFRPSVKKQEDFNVYLLDN